ncbi:MAG: hypothetical protein LBB20_01915 [Puniceicoccales bacterium]|jgi:hypothetical protein|nr:hypothetical protein [Puniceicoccales bacterium]
MGAGKKFFVIKKLNIWLLSLIVLGCNGYGDPDVTDIYTDKNGNKYKRVLNERGKRMSNHESIISGLGLTLYDVLHYGDCGYWSIAIAKDPKKGRYTWEDMLSIRNIVHPDLADNITSPNSYWLGNTDCIDIARHIKRPIICLSTISGGYNNFNNTVTGYVCCPDGKVRIVNFLYKYDQWQRPITNLKWVKCSSSDANAKIELIQKLYGGSKSRYCDINRIFTDYFFHCEKIFDREILDKWLTNEAKKTVPGIDGNGYSLMDPLLNYAYQTFIKNGNRKDSDFNPDFLDAWVKFFKEQIPIYEKLQSAISSEDAIFIYIEGAYWMAALKEVTINGKTGLLCADNKTIRTTNKLESLTKINIDPNKNRNINSAFNPRSNLRNDSDGNYKTTLDTAIVKVPVERPHSGNLKTGHHIVIRKHKSANPTDFRKTTDRNPTGRVRGRRRNGNMLVFGKKAKGFGKSKPKKHKSDGLIRKKKTKKNRRIDIRKRKAKKRRSIIRRRI